MKLPLTVLLLLAGPCQVLTENRVHAFQAVADSDEASTESADRELLGHGYTRQGDKIYFDGKRIDREGQRDLDRFARALGQPLTLAAAVDAKSFIALSEEYAKDQNQVYYKHISPGRFWVVQLEDADPKSFVDVGFNLAKDRKRVWWYGRVLPGLDPKTLEVVRPGFVWKDARHVWYQHEIIPGADPATFEHVGQAFYRDESHVYWSTTRLDGADPKTLRTFGDMSPYAADRYSVWFADQRQTAFDAATFSVVHEQVTRDKRGVYVSGVRVDGAQQVSIRKLADLDDHLCALLTDGRSHYVFAPLWNDLFQVSVSSGSLHVKRGIWEGKGPEQVRIGESSAQLTEIGWQGLQAPDAYVRREAQTLVTYQEQFRAAWELLSNEAREIVDSELLADIIGASPRNGNYREPGVEDQALLREYAELQRAFYQYYEEWLEKNPLTRNQVENGAYVDVAEVFAAELFDGADSKLDKATRRKWRRTAVSLAEKHFQLQLRRLRPPVYEKQP